MALAGNWEPARRQAALEASVLAGIVQQRRIAATFATSWSRVRLGMRGNVGG
jgi:hypothetical protein